MKALCRTAIALSVLATTLVCGTARAQQSPGAGDPFSIWFDENGNSTVLPDGGTAYSNPGFSAVDPNTTIAALTYALPETIYPGVVDIADPNSGAVSDAISFYNIGQQGYMAFYSTLPGNALADTISAGFVPSGPVLVTEDANDHFTWLPGGNAYYGVSGVPDGGSTLAMLGVASALFGTIRRRLGK